MQLLLACHVSTASFYGGMRRHHPCGSSGVAANINKNAIYSEMAFASIRPIVSYDGQHRAYTTVS
jgi:hypothetical protein